VRRLVRWPAALGALLLAAPASAYVLPATVAVRKASEKRALLALTAVEASGTLEVFGAAQGRLRGLSPAAGGASSASARVVVKTGHRARLDLLAAGMSDAERPYAALRDERLAGQGGLEATPAASALLKALATFLGSAPGGDGRALAESLIRRGVRLDETSLGRTGGRVAVVLGGKPGDPQPLAWLDKETFQPLRLQLQEGGAALDVRLLDWSSQAGGAWFPRVVEVWEKEALLLRFTTEKATANPKLPDALF
jgi:hypothetical protein